MKVEALQHNMLQGLADLAPNESLWRYVDIHKFLSFLHNQSIMFSRMDTFEDVLEGMPVRFLIAQKSRVKEDDPLLLIKENRQHAAIQQKHFVSCWFIGFRESTAMWNLYSNKDSVAIKLNPAYLLAAAAKSLVDIDAQMPLSSAYSGKVQYVDLVQINTEVAYNVKHVGLRKDVGFESEKEFRLVISAKDHKNQFSQVPFKLPALKKAAFDVICHPRMPKWKQDNIQWLMEQNGFTQHFKPSEIRLR
ncbi:hypothetical protein [Chitinophaga skermanii]|nr:hypothetical protein [Chitinophaga skermanii]